MSEKVAVFSLAIYNGESIVNRSWNGITDEQIQAIINLLGEPGSSQLLGGKGLELAFGSIGASIIDLDTQ